MADIRRTSMIDDFNRADEDPLSGGGIWGKSFTDYYAMTNLDDRATRPYYNPSVRAYPHWTAQGFDGDCEIWAQRVNLAPIVGHSDRLFMAAGLGGGAIASSTWDGYLVLFYRLTSGPSCYLYRADNGTFTLLDSLVASVTNSAWAYLGRRGNERGLGDADSNFRSS